MIKKFLFAVSILVGTFFSADAQLKVGDDAPDLHIIKWLKGKPVSSFEKGKVYIVEFSFVACKPCRASIPHLTDWSRKYRKEDKVEVISVFTSDSDPKKPTDLSYIKLIQGLVDYMGNKMDYTVAVDVPKQDTRRAWGDIQGFPTLYIVNQEGKIAYNNMGNADEIDFALESIVNTHHFDPQAFLEKTKQQRIDNKRWDELEDELNQLWDNANAEGALNKIDSALTKSPEEKKEDLLLAKFKTYLYIGDSTKADEYLKQVMAIKHSQWEGLHNELYLLANKRYFLPPINYNRYLAIADSAYAEMGIPSMQAVVLQQKASVVYNYTHDKAAALAILKKGLALVQRNASIHWMEGYNQAIEQLERTDKQTKQADADWKKMMDTIDSLGSTDLNKINMEQGNVAQHRFISESRKKQAAMAEDFWNKYPGNRRRYYLLTEIFLKANFTTVPWIGNISPELEKQLNNEVAIFNEDRVKYPNKQLEKYASPYFRMFPIDLAAQAEWIRKGDAMVKEISASGCPRYLRESFEWALFARDWRSAAFWGRYLPNANERADDDITKREADFWKGAIDQYWQGPLLRFYQHVEKYADIPGISYRAADFLSGISMFEPELALNYWQQIIDKYSDPANPLFQKEGVQALVKRAHEQLYVLKIMEGKIPVNMKFTALDGREIDLANYKGKVVLIDFWASWCKPCVGEMPALKAIYDKYHDKGFEMIGICMDDESKREEVKKLLTKNSLIGPQRFEGKGMEGDTYHQLYHINALPTVWLLDKNGYLVNNHARGEYLEPLLRKYLQLD